MKLLSWAPADGMSPWAWVYPASQTPLEAIVSVASHYDLYSLTAGHRGIFIDAPVPTVTQDETSFVDFYTVGADWSARTDWYEEFWGYVRSLTPRVDYVIMDWEAGLSYWSLELSTRKTNIAALQATGIMPPELNAIDPVAVFDDFLSPTQRPNVNALNRWLRQQYDAQLHRAVTANMRNLIGYEPSVSNFVSYRYRSTVALLDINGWEIPSSPMAANTSAPDFTPNSGYSGGGAADVARLTTQLQECEGRILPWISYPSFASQGEALFDLASDELLANNDIIEALLVWNPEGLATGADNTRIVSNLGGS